MRHGRNPGSGRGRHRRAGSPETKAWQELERQIDAMFAPPPKPPKRKKRKPLPRPPECPPWLRPEEYAELVALREKLS
jgi:hypothetical protein